MSTVLEVMACGSAVISTRHSGTAEIIEHSVHQVNKISNFLDFFLIL
jgi:glycosyltransferase involved in cell wall biosynthesis